MKKLLRVEYIVLLLVSLVFMLYISGITSPIGAIYNYSGDSGVFLYMGKGILNGKIPYKDMFDHKGFILYLINAIGQILIHGKYGVFLLQVVNIWIVMLFTYGICKKYLNAKKSFCIIFFSLIFLAGTLRGGNLTEEWSLSWIMMCVWLSLNIFEQIVENKKITWVFYAFVYGVSAAVTCNTRLNNCIIIGICVLFLLIILIRKKQWKEIAQCTIGFIGGIAVIFIPIITYFVKNNAVYDWFYGNVVFNLKYTSNNKIELMTTVQRIIVLLFPIIWCVYYRKVNTNLPENKRLTCKYLIFSSCILGVSYLLTGVTYHHYAVFMYPILIITVAMFLEYILGRTKIMAFIVLFCTLLLPYIHNGLSMIKIETNNIISFIKGKEENISGYSAYMFAEKIEDIITDKKNVLVYNENGCNAPVGIYNVANLWASTKWFTHHQLYNGFDNVVYNDINEIMRNHPPEWLVLSEDYEFENEKMYLLVESTYNSVYNEYGYCLLKKNK